MADLTLFFAFVYNLFQKWFALIADNWLLQIPFAMFIIGIVITFVRMFYPRGKDID